MPTKNIDLPTLIEKFSDEDACHTYLEALRWPESVSCPGRKAKNGTRAECGSSRVVRLKKRRLFECAECGYQFSTRVGTIFEDSKLPLWKWFLAVYMMCESRKSVSANQLKRMLGVSYKTAWFLCHRIRKAMFDENGEPLTGIVEADETFLGGKKKGREFHGGSGKTVVLGAVERGGRARLRVAPDRQAAAIREFIDESVSEDADALYTDAYRAYKSAARKKGVVHGRVNHSRKEWVNGQIHTNTIENVWSLLDRSIIGAYHKVSTKHLPAYLSEVEWRYNNRENPYLFRDTIVELIGCAPLEYGKLIAS